VEATLQHSGAGAVAARSRPTRAHAEPILAEVYRAGYRGYHRDVMSAARRTYTIEEANALIPQVRAVLLQLAVQQRRLDEAHGEMHRQLDGNGDPQAAAEASRREAEVSETAEGMRGLIAHLEALGIQLRDVEMGLVDFPAEREGRAVWLCWRLADPEVGHWHGTDEGYATRRPW